jgi:hypothetical protein
MTNPGLRAGLSVPAPPAWRNSCQRSGSSSSIRSAGWVLMRSSTSRRQACGSISRAAPVVQSPDHHDVDLAPPCGLQEQLMPGTLLRARADILDLLRDFPASIVDIRSHRIDLHPQSLLVVRRDSRVKCGAYGWPSLAKNPLRFDVVKPLASPRPDGRSKAWPFSILFGQSCRWTPPVSSGRAKALRCGCWGACSPDPRRRADRTSK